MYVDAFNDFNDEDRKITLALAIDLAWGLTCPLGAEGLLICSGGAG